MSIAGRVRPGAGRSLGRFRGRVLGAELRSLGRELGLAALGGLVYFLIRGGVVDRADEALGRARDVMALERRLGIFWEPEMQGWILESRFLIDVFNGVYFWLHMPLIAGMGLWLFWRKRAVYRVIRNAFVGSALVGLLIYATLPLAPPRFFPELGFVDTMALYSEANYQAQEVGIFVNPYAALPSLHFGWALLLGVALWLARPGGRWNPVFALGAVLIPLGQLFAIVLTGNHFLIDAAAGAGAAGFGLAAAQYWRQRRDRIEGQANADDDVR